ncbi:MAG TPA: hypothetical protein VGL56_11400 [Fimbriimonadaceae bacterium]|jgi:hypothetical protein
MISALILAHVLTANTVAAQQPVLLRYKFHTGQSRRYKTVMDMNMKMNMGAQNMPMKMVMDSIVKQTVKSVDGSGAGHIAIQPISQNSTMYMNGKPTKSPMPSSTKTVNMTMAPDGEVSGLDVGGSNPMAMMGGGSSASPFAMTGALPSKAVSPGSHWNSSANVMGSGIEMASKLDRIGSVNGHSVAFISASGSMDLGKMLGAIGKGKGVTGSGSINMNLHYRFDITSGCLLDTSGTMTYKMNMGASKGSMDMNGVADMKVSLVQ